MTKKRQKREEETSRKNH